MMKQRIWMAGLSALVLAGAALAQSPPPPAGKCVARVHDVEITRADLETAMKLQGPLPAGVSDAQRRTRQIQALGMLIDDILMRHFLAKQVRPVDPAEVTRRVAEMERWLQSQKPARSLAEFCQDTNQTVEQLRSRIADMIRWSEYAKTRITEQELARYYAENKEKFDGTTVQASHIVLRLPKGAAAAEREKAQKSLDEIRRQVVAGKADFAELAKKYSQDHLAEKGGDVGEVTRQWHDENFARAAFSLKVGEVSDVVQTDYGLHLIKVTGRKDAQALDFARIKESVRVMYEEEKRQQILTQLREEARKNKAIEIHLP